MEVTETSKLLFGLITALGTGTAIYYNFGQTRKIQAELLEKFEFAVIKSQKHSVTELFRLIHGLRMSYSDVRELIKHDDCSKIIFALKKSPGTVCYKNGSFQYSNVGGNKIVQNLDRFFNRIGIIIFGIFSIFSFSLLIFGKSNEAITGFILLLISSAMLATQFRERNFNSMVLRLVTPKQDSW